MRNFTLVSFLRLTAVLCFLLAGSGCAGSRFSDSRQSPRARMAPPSIKTINMEVPRTQLLNALQQEILIDKARIVEVYQPRSSEELPLYRLFDIHPKSVYGVLGLKNGDVLVAANERTLANTEVFKQYVRLLRNEKEAQVEIIRGAEPILLKYHFVG